MKKLAYLITLLIGNQMGGMDAQALRIGQSRQETESAITSFRCAVLDGTVEKVKTFLDSYPHDLTIKENGRSMNVLNYGVKGALYAYFGNYKAWNNLSYYQIFDMCLAAGADRHVEDGRFQSLAQIIAAGISYLETALPQNAEAVRDEGKKWTNRLAVIDPIRKSKPYNIFSVDQIIQLHNKIFYADVVSLEIFMREYDNVQSYINLPAGDGRQPLFTAVQGFAIIDQITARNNSMRMFSLLLEKGADIAQICNRKTIEQELEDAILVRSVTITYDKEGFEEECNRWREAIKNARIKKTIDSGTNSALATNFQSAPVVVQNAPSPEKAQVLAKLAEIRARQAARASGSVK